MEKVEQKNQSQSPEKPVKCEAQPENDKKKNIDTSKITTGEKYYGILKFGVAEATIVTATALIAYWARYGEKSALNIFKYMQDTFEKWLKPVANIGKTGSKSREVGAVVAAASASTMVTFHGGNAFAPAMKWFDGAKRDIVNYFNRKFGDKGELEIGQERLKNDPEQSWSDVVKGRVVAFAVVVSSFLSAMLLIGKNKKNNAYHFDNFEEKFGRWIAGFTKEGKEIAKISVHEHPKLAESHPHLATNKAYRFGKILALDIYATTASVIIWNVISELSARKRHAQLKQKNALHEDNETSTFAAAHKPRSSYSEVIAAERTAAEAQPLHLGG